MAGVKAAKSEARVAAAPPRRARGAGRTALKPVTAAPRERILRAAEALFAEHGTSGVGLRAISAAADVNLASIAYHFGSKEGLIEELFALRAAPIAQARTQLLDTAEAAAGGAPPLESILDAFVRPALTLGPQPPEGGQAFGRLRARLATESEKLARRILSKAFDKSSRRFIDAIAKALPDLPRVQVEWRFHFMLGTMYYTMANSGRIQALTGGRCDPGDIDQALTHMIPFLAAGFRSAPVSAHSP